MRSNWKGCCLYALPVKKSGTEIINGMPSKNTYIVTPMLNLPTVFVRNVSKSYIRNLMVRQHPTDRRVAVHAALRQTSRAGDQCRKPLAGRGGASCRFSFRRCSAQLPFRPFHCKCPVTPQQLAPPFSGIEQPVDPIDRPRRDAHPTLTASLQGILKHGGNEDAERVPSFVTGIA